MLFCLSGITINLSSFKHFPSSTYDSCHHFLLLVLYPTGHFCLFGHWIFCGPDVRTTTNAVCHQRPWFWIFPECWSAVLSPPPLPYRSLSSGANIYFIVAISPQSGDEVCTSLPDIGIFLHKRVYNNGPNPLKSPMLICRSIIPWRRASLKNGHWSI